VNFRRRRIFIKEHVKATAVQFVALCLLGCAAGLHSKADNPREKYALIAERNRYSDIGMSDLEVEYRNTKRVRDFLLGAGWPADGIRALRDFDEDDLATALRRLRREADGNDLVFVYVFGHGRHLSDRIDWDERIVRAFRGIDAETKVVVIDACRAGALTRPLAGPGVVAVGAVKAGEYAWAGVPSEGLPVIGGVFTWAFVGAFADPRADQDGDGRVSVVEAARRAEATQREYLHGKVFPVEEFRMQFHRVGVRPEEDPGYPRVVIHDGVGHPVHLEW
jgi:hypothetical protein